MRQPAANSSTGSLQPRASYVLIAANTAIRIASRLPRNARAETAGSGTSSRPLPWPTRKTPADSPLPFPIACSYWTCISRSLTRPDASANQRKAAASLPFPRRSNPPPEARLPSAPCLAFFAATSNSPKCANSSSAPPKATLDRKSASNPNTPTLSCSVLHHAREDG